MVPKFVPSATRVYFNLCYYEKSRKLYRWILLNLAFVVNFHLMLGILFEPCFRIIREDLKYPLRNNIFYFKELLVKECML